MRVLIDTDVVLDLMLKRPAFFADTFALWQAGDRGRYQRYIAAITPINAFYVARKFMDLASARQAIGELLGNVTVCVIDGNVLSAAHSSAMTDFEDAVQVEAARVAGERNGLAMSANTGVLERNGLVMKANVAALRIEAM